MILAKKTEKEQKTDVSVIAVIVVLNSTGHCSPGWPRYVAQTDLSSAVIFCLGFLRGGITGMHCHTWLEFILFITRVTQHLRCYWF